MSRFLILIPILVLAGCGFEAVEAQSTPASFPKSWFGKWTGEIKVEPYEGAIQKLPMSLTIGPAEGEQAGRWQFAIQYGSQPTRNYELVAVKPKKGHYQIDEKNSIVLPAWYTNGELVSIFSLKGQILTTHYERVGDEIRFSVLVTKTAPTRLTGGVDQIPSVGVHLPTTYQRARLKRSAD